MMKERFLQWLLQWLLRHLEHQPGTVIKQGRRKYIVDINGAWRRLGRE